MTSTAGLLKSHHGPWLAAAGPARISATDADFLLGSILIQQGLLGLGRGGLVPPKWHGCRLRTRALRHA